MGPGVRPRPFEGESLGAIVGAGVTTIGPGVRPCLLVGAVLGAMGPGVRP